MDEIGLFDESPLFPHRLDRETHVLQRLETARTKKITRGSWRGARREPAADDAVDGVLGSGANDEKDISLLNWFGEVEV